MTDDQIFRSGSTTYYWSSKFFSPTIRKDVAKLYSFVRVADNFVDAIPQDKKGFDAFERSWRRAAAGKKVRSKKNDSTVRIIQNMYEVAQKYHFDYAWIDAFLASMRMDLKGRTYKTLDDTLEYIYGSAEVIGLMMLAILRPDIIQITQDAKDKPSEALTPIEQQARRVCDYAKLQGRAMQYINFIRDIDEDAQLGRCYFPQSELEKYGLVSVDYKGAMRHPPEFREFIEGQIAYYNEWQAEANKGFRYIPYRQRIALRTAVDMYNWTAREIAQSAFVVFDKKVKPSKFRVIMRAIVRIPSV